MAIQLGATTDSDLIELSGKEVYTHPLKDEKLDVNGHEYRVVEQSYDTSSGLDYMVVKNVETGEISMIFEGTQGIKDVVTDGTLPGTVPDAQLRAADEAYKRLSGKYAISYVGGEFAWRWACQLCGLAK
nr:hypothetical protein [Listeria floridensis]